MTLDLAHITDHEEQAVGYMLEQDDGKPRMEAFVEIIATRWQVVEDLAWAMATERWLDTAIGVQLDKLGDILDWERGGLTDDQYRLFLKARVLCIQSDGRLMQLLEILDVLDYVTIASWEQPPAHMQIEVCDCTIALETDRILRLAKGGGVGMLFVYSQFDRSNTFQSSDIYATASLSATRGAGSVYDLGVGGRSAGGFR